jgi:hypothetical protein
MMMNLSQTKNKKKFIKIQGNIIQTLHFKNKILSTINPPSKIKLILRILIKKNKMRILMMRPSM